MVDGRKKTPILMASENGKQNYLGINARQVSYEEITKLPIAMYLQKAGRFLNTSPASYHDTAVIVPDVPITPQSEGNLFINGMGDSGRVYNSGAVIARKSKALTNMSGDGTFEGGVTFIMERVEVKILIASDKNAVVDGEIVNPTVVAEADFSSAIHLYALTTQIELAFFRNEQEMFSGFLDEFPSTRLASGAFGNDDGFIQNGSGGQIENKMPRARVLETGDKFSFKLRYVGAAGFTPQVPVNIRVSMVGQAVKPLFA